MTRLSPTCSVGMTDLADPGIMLVYPEPERDVAITAGAYLHGHADDAENPTTLWHAAGPCFATGPSPERLAVSEAREQVTALVLAGGRATRMGGTDKGLVPLAGRPMIAWVLDAVAPQAARVLVNANRNLDAYGSFGFEVVPDAHPGFLGPLAGLVTGMTHAATGFVITAPCDSPLVAGDLVERLHSACLAESADIAVAHDGQRLQPVFALARTSLKSDLENWLESGERKIDRWFARHRTVQVDLSDRAETFINVNNPEDRDALEARLAEHDGGTAV